MGVYTTADERMDRAKSLVEEARKLVGEVLIDRDMWGAAQFRDGLVRNVFDRLDATLRVMEGGDPEGDARAAQAPLL